jgi:hypothetical protein
LWIAARVITNRNRANHRCGAFAGAVFATIGAEFRFLGIVFRSIRGENHGVKWDAS